jgi:WD40 repeat protein
MELHCILQSKPAPNRRRTPFSSTYRSLINPVFIILKKVNLLQLWDIDTKTQINVYDRHRGWVHTVAFSPDGTQLVSGSADATIKVCTLSLIILD